MRCAAWLCVLMFTRTLMATDDETAFISLLSEDHLSNWSGDAMAWTMRRDEIRGNSARESTPLVYEGRSFGDYILRFSAQIRTGSLRMMLRNLPFAWSLEIDTERVRLRAGGGGSVEFLNKRGEWAEYEVRMQGRKVHLLRNGKDSDFDHVASDFPETGKISLQLADRQGSEVVLTKLRIRPLSRLQQAK